MRETTSLGAAIAAGFAIDVWSHFDELKEINQDDRRIFEPATARKKVRRCLGNGGKPMRLEANYFLHTVLTRAVKQ